MDYHLNGNDRTYSEKHKFVSYFLGVSICLFVFTYRQDQLIPSFLKLFSSRTLSFRYTKECKYRMDNDMPHTNCYCQCHKIIMAESSKMESRTF